MNPQMLPAMANLRCREMRHDAARYASAVPRPSRPAPVPFRWPWMRRQVGYALVEAGLHLLTTDGPGPRG
jgi:hypothetical protein